jgi:hypothetical protein
VRMCAELGGSGAGEAPAGGRGIIVCRGVAPGGFLSGMGGEFSLPRPSGVPPSTRVFFSFCTRLCGKGHIANQGQPAVFWLNLAEPTAAVPVMYLAPLSVN